MKTVYNLGFAMLVEQSFSKYFVIRASIKVTRNDETVMKLAPDRYM